MSNKNRAGVPKGPYTWIVLYLTLCYTGAKCYTIPLDQMMPVVKASPDLILP